MGDMKQDVGAPLTKAVELMPFLLLQQPGHVESST